MWWNVLEDQRARMRSRSKILFQKLSCILKAMNTARHRVGIQHTGIHCPLNTVLVGTLHRVCEEGIASWKHKSPLSITAHCEHEGQCITNQGDLVVPLNINSHINPGHGQANVIFETTLWINQVYWLFWNVHIVKVSFNGLIVPFFSIYDRCRLKGIEKENLFKDFQEFPSDSAG